MKLSKILFLMLGVLLTFSFVGCDNFSLKDSLYTLSGTTLTIVNKTENTYQVNVEGVDRVNLESYDTIKIRVFYDHYNIITLTDINSEVVPRYLGRYFDGPYTWMVVVVEEEG